MWQETGWRGTHDQTSGRQLDTFPLAPRKPNRPSFVNVTRILGLTFLLLCTCLAAESTESAEPKPDQLRFKNGDRISGQIVRQTPEEVVFRSPVLGEITLPRKEVQIIRGGAAPEVPVEALVGIAPMNGNGDSPPSQPTPPSPQSKPAQQPAPEPPPPAVNEAARIADAVDAVETEPWKGKLEFGLRQQQGRRDIFSVDIRGSADRTVGPNDLRAKARLLYGEQDGRVNNDRYDASFQWRRELGERTFAQSLTSYFQDDLKDINRNWEQNIGAGYRLLDSKEHVINLGAGLTGQYREANFSPSGFYTLIELFQDYTYRITKRLTIRQNAQAQYSPEGGTRFLSVGSQPSSALKEETNYKVRFNTVLQGKLTQNLSMNLRFEFEYDNAVRPSSARTDQRIISSIGYAF